MKKVLLLALLGFVSLHASEDDNSLGAESATADVPAAEGGGAAAPTVDDATLLEQLISAIDAEDIDLIDQLLEKGANINGATKYDTPLIRAVSNKSQSMIQYLLEKGADINQVMQLSSYPNTVPYTALAEAVTDLNVDLVKMLLDAGADVNIRYLDFKLREEPISMVVIRPGFSAQSDKRAKCLDVLLQAGLDVDSINSDNETALMVAVQRARISCVEVLLDAGANKDLVNNQGKTALDIAYALENEEIIRLLGGGSSRSGDNSRGSRSYGESSYSGGGGGGGSSGRRATGSSEDKVSAAMSLLGLKSGFTKWDLTKAYRTLSLKHHPDKESGSTEAFQQLNAANELLKKYTK